MSDEASRESAPESAGAEDEASRAGAPESAGAEDEAKDGGEAGEAGSEEAPKERVDADGLPIDRDPTIDDVRSTEARHGRIAFGCTLAVVLLLVIFWLVRGGLIG